MKKLILSFLAMANFVAAYAQKLPNVQQVSLRAPANVKIDGKATEWKNNFLANNLKTGIKYTMANDDEKLYLVVQTTDDNVLNRIVNGGIKLVIKKNDSRNEENAALIKFPFLQKGQKTRVDFSNIRVISTAAATTSVRPPKPSSKAEAEAIADSLMNLNNKRIAANSKFIYTSGLADVETILSIYNEIGIKVASAVDSKKVYTWELSVDLKLIKLNVVNNPKFYYRIVINDEPNKYSIHPYTVTDRIAPDGTHANAEEIQAANAEVQALAAFRSSTTDFSGEYTLAK